MLAIVLLCVSKGAAANDEGNDCNFSSIALFIALLTFAGITVVEDSGCFCRRQNPLDFTNDVILSFAAENAFPARSATALIPLSPITSMAFIPNCLTNGATFGAFL